MNLFALTLTGMVVDMNRECKHIRCSEKAQSGTGRIDSRGVNRAFDYCGQIECPAYQDRIKADSKRVWK